MMAEEDYWLVGRKFRERLLKPFKLGGVYYPILAEWEGGIQGDEGDSLLREAIVPLVIGKQPFPDNPTCTVPADIVISQSMIYGDVQG